MTTQDIKRRHAALREQELEDWALIHRALAAGAQLPYPSGLPKGRFLSYLYDGVPGVWSVDHTGSHWCSGIKAEWITGARNFLNGAPA